MKKYFIWYVWSIWKNGEEIFSNNIKRKVKVFFS